MFFQKEKYKRLAIFSEEEYIETKRFYDTLVRNVIQDIEHLPSELKVFPQDNKKIILENYEVVPSLLDPLGLVIKKDDMIYRGIFPKSLEHFKSLWESGLLQGLAKYKLIPGISLTNFYTEDFPVVLQCEKVDILQPAFWSFSRTKESAILLLVISEVSKHFNYQLIDGHCFNTGFYNGKAIFIDIGSFIKLKNEKPFFDELFNYHIKELTKNFDQTFATSHPSSKKRCKKSISQVVNKIFYEKRPSPACIHLFFQYIQSETVWAKYGFWSKETIERSKQDKDRFFRISELINIYSPDAKTSLDLAGNAGFMSALLSTTKKLDRIISSDLDENAIEYGHLIANKEKLPIEFALLDVANFTACNFDDIKGDILLALALTHHLLLANNYEIDSMFYMLKRFVKKHIYIEFCPLGLWSLGNELVDIPDWYTTEYFEKYFIRHFKLLHKEVVGKVTINNKEYDHRILFIGELETNI